MTALEAVAVHLPAESVPIEQVAQPLGLSAKEIVLFRRFHGLDRVVLDSQGTLPDLLRGAVGALKPLHGREKQVRYVLHARTMPVTVPYPANPLHEVCHEFGLEHASSFTVTHHGCASSLLAIDLAGRLLAAEPDPQALALIVAGEKAFTRDAQLVPEASLFSEGAAACLVRAGEGSGRDRMLSYSAVLRGEFNGRLSEDHDLMFRYQRAYPELLAAAIGSALDSAGTSLEDLRLILPHNVNRVVWKRLCQSIGFPLEKVVLDNVRPLGHSFAADALINYHTAASRGLFEPGDRYLMAAAGLGAAFSAMVFEH
ncbi:MAG TPA: 3-oxoacyl-[acyl-carrier-protein] synthase III C-terminal domain-containing protein [Actinocrinis sp.]